MWNLCLKPLSRWWLLLSDSLTEEVLAHIRNLLGIWGKTLLLSGLPLPRL